MIVLIPGKAIFLSPGKHFRIFHLFLQTLLVWYSLNINNDKNEWALLMVIIMTRTMLKEYTAQVCLFEYC